MRIETPRRVKRSYRQHLLATPDAVFPLLCPVRERDWVPGWDPEVVFSDSGVNEPGCVFVTRDGERTSIWTVVAHDAAAGRVEMVKTTPGFTVCRLAITLSPGQGGSTEAEVSYEHTALAPEGERFVAEEFTEAYYTEHMRRWESTLNAYLRDASEAAS